VISKLIPFSRQVEKPGEGWIWTIQATNFLTFASVKDNYLIIVTLRYFYEQSQGGGGALTIKKTNLKYSDHFCDNVPLPKNGSRKIVASFLNTTTILNFSQQSGLIKHKIIITVILRHYKVKTFFLFCLKKVKRQIICQ